MKLFSKKVKDNEITFVVGQDQRIYEIVRDYAYSIASKGTITSVCSKNDFTTITILTANNVSGIKYTLNKRGFDLHLVGNGVIVRGLES